MSSEDLLASRTYVDHWIRASRTAVLVVPSVVTGGRENNIVLNPAHSQFSLIRSYAPKAIEWDERLIINT